MEQSYENTNRPERDADIDTPIAPNEPDVNPRQHPSGGEPSGGDDSAAVSAQPAAEAEMDLDALIEEAERRGYLRGRNEAIGQVKKKLRQYEVPVVAEPANPTMRSYPTILDNRSQSIWDK